MITMFWGTQCITTLNFRTVRGNKVLEHI